MIFSRDKLRSVRDKDLRKEGILVAEGRFLVERYLASRWRVDAVLCAEHLRGEIRTLVEEYTRRSGQFCDFRILSGEEIAEAAGYPFHRGVFAIGPRPASLSLADFLRDNPFARRIVVCPDLTDTENVGSIIRSAAAFGFDAFVAGSRCADPLSRRVLRVSMGGVFTLPMVAAAGGAADSRGTEEAGEAAGLLNAAGFTIIGAAAPSASIAPATLSPVPLADFAPQEKTAILLGGEGYGIPEDWAAVCDAFTTIPMGGAKPGTPDSLNVGVAAGIIMYHLSAPFKRRG